MPADSHYGIPAIRGVRWFNVAILTITPAIAAYGLWCSPRNYATIMFAFAYYLFSMLGDFAHDFLQVIIVYGLIARTTRLLSFKYSYSVEGRAPYKDTDLDPYNANRGLFWTHIGWMIFKSDLRSGQVDVSDLSKDKLIQWQHRWYFLNAFVFGYILPTLVPGLLWNDWLGGLCLSGALRMTVVHHCVFCINSIAHYLGSASYDDALSPRDHLLSAILTLGEGYHNFHHQFPMDYRNAFLWYQYDPTKWFIATCAVIGLASHLRRFPSNEITKGALSMKLKELQKIQESLTWPTSSEKLPVVTWETFQEESMRSTLILVSGFIHDVSSFVDGHPGGRNLLLKNSGKDMTTAFFGGVYAHSNAAHNLLAMMRIGILAGGGETPTGFSPSQRLYIAQRSQKRD
ncbi:Acyl-CoA desaturase [Termitomyces sp. J132]|nr:Acyl-CoA desaturase [Termitomyces sp. J132]